MYTLSVLGAAESRENHNMEIRVRVNSFSGAIVAE